MNPIAEMDELIEWVAVQEYFMSRRSLLDYLKRMKQNEKVLALRVLFGAIRDEKITSEYVLEKVRFSKKSTRPWAMLHPSLLRVYYETRRGLGL